ncbi:MAG: P1 family peptidase [Candidatus Aminicenantes bacterium]|nr:MAG: P1 family peptidase [Candidatus Aminicenantes bacterium]
MIRRERLKLLRIDSAGFERGPKNSITDIKGVKAGHLTIHKDFKDSSGKKIFIRTGLTAVVPYDMKEEKRLFAGCFLFRCKNEVTGYEVIDDFCYLNSPVVISNSYNIGKVYNAILSFGFSLNRTEIWPPVILGVNDSCLNEMSKSTVNENQVLRVLHDASSDHIEEGSVGIGLGLRAFDWKGGIGTSSRILSLDNRQFSLGTLVAANHGNKTNLERQTPKQNINKSELENGSLTVILATDIPLVPYQIRQIVTTLAAGLPSVNIMRNPKDSIACLLFSTANAMSLENEAPSFFVYSLVSDSSIEKIVKAGAEVIKEAILRSLLLSTSAQGRLGRRVETIPDKEFKKILKKF